MFSSERQRRRATTGAEAKEQLRGMLEALGERLRAAPEYAAPTRPSGPRTYAASRHGAWQACCGLRCVAFVHQKSSDRQSRADLGDRTLAAV